MTLGSTTKILLGGTCRAALPALQAWSDQLCGLEALVGVFVKTSHGKRDQGLTKVFTSRPYKAGGFLQCSQLLLLTLLWVIIWWEKLSGVMEGNA